MNYGTRYLVLFRPQRYNAIYDRIRCLIIKTSGVTYSINHNFTSIRTDSYNYLPIEETLTFHNVIILIKSVFDNNQNHFYCNIFLEKGSYKDNAQFFKLYVCTL